MKYMKVLKISLISLGVLTGLASLSWAVYWGREFFVINNLVDIAHSKNDPAWTLIEKLYECSGNFTFSVVGMYTTALIFSIEEDIVIENK